MSKCDISIEFDRSDRTYRGGEDITGTVRVRVNQNVKCEGVIVEHYWETHGRGNTDRSEKIQQVFRPGDLRMGDAISQRFEFLVPPGPPTYHGHYLNIDHYIGVRVDVPWAIDPKQKAEYFLQPGSGDYKELATSDDQVTQSRALETYGLPAAIVCLVLGIICIFPFGFVLIPLGLVLLFFALRKSFAERKLGPVQLDFARRTLTPGESEELRFSCMPRKSCSVKEITATLTGTEQCTSGSGTNKTTHTHKIAEEAIRLMGPTDLAAGAPATARATVHIPETVGYSFSASDNKIAWNVAVRVDIPSWPDWVENIPLTVRPTIVESTNEQQPPAIDTPTPAPPPPSPVAELPDPTISPPVKSVSEPVAQVKAAAALRQFLDRIMKADRFGSHREDLVTEVLDDVFEVEVDVDSVSRTFGSFFDERYRDGRTVRGKLVGTDHMLETQFVASRNDELDRLAMGDRVQVTAVPVRWDATFERLELREQE